MRKITKKLLALAFGGAMLLSMTGCGMGYTSTSSELPTFALEASQLKELDVKELYDDTLGYSFRGVPYGISPEEVGEKLGVEMGIARKLGNTEYTCYYPEQAATLVGGEVPITMEFVFNGDMKFRSVTYQYMAGGNSMTPESLDKLFDGTLERLQEAYGEQTEIKEASDDTGNSAKLESVTYNWKKDTGDGYITSLQLVKGDYGYGTDIVILGVIRYSYEEEAAAQSAEAEEEK